MVNEIEGLGEVIEDNVGGLVGVKDLGYYLFSHQKISWAGSTRVKSMLGGA